MRNTILTFTFLFSALASFATDATCLKDTLPNNGKTSLNTAELDEIDRILVASYMNHFCFSADADLLNAHNYPKDHVPNFPDELTAERMKILDRETPFDFVYNQSVKDFISLYAVRRRDVTGKVLGLSQLYFPMMEECLAKYNIPQELKYLSIVESALNPTAISKAGAAGLWQFMVGTGKMYGLEVSSYQDERFDPIKETEAACKYLRFLYNTFGDWNLALAAYNSGPGNVNKAIRRAGGVKDFWKIKQYLPKETQGYVPAFIAVNFIMNYSTEYNIYPKKPAVTYFETDTIHIKSRVDFAQVSKIINIPIEEIIYLNGTYKLKEIPDNGKKHYLYLPVEKVGDFLAHEKEIYAASEIKRPEPELADTTTNETGSEVTTKIVWEDEWKSHKVKKGETLKSIATKYGVSSSDVKKWNKMSSSTVKIGQSLKIKVRVKKTITVPAPKDEKVEGGQAENKMSEEEAKKKAEEEAKKKAADEAKRKADEEARRKQQQADAKVEYVYHTVKSGETLSKIANTHKVSVDSIVKLNKGLNPNKLMVGQKIKVKKKK